MKKYTIKSQMMTLEEECSHLIKEMAIKEIEYNEKQSRIKDLKIKLLDDVSEYNDFLYTYWQVNGYDIYFKILDIRKKIGITMRTCLFVRANPKLPCIHISQEQFEPNDFEFKFVNISNEMFDKKFNETNVKFVNIL